MDTLDFLLSPPGSTLLDELATTLTGDEALLREVTRLRRRWPAELVSAAVETVTLRRKAVAKFSRAGRMFFTPAGLEQASAELISRYHARRYQDHPGGVLEVCCGIGGDTIALAEGRPVIGVDLDRRHLEMARANARVYGVAERFQAVEGDGQSLPVRPGWPVWADPSRRQGERRIFTLHDYRPALPTLVAAAQLGPGGGIKLSPGVDYAELQGILGAVHYEVEIISVEGDCREAVLWLGEFARGTHRATLLPGEHSLEGAPTFGALPVTGVGAYVYEPDGAVVRAHLVENLAALIGATKIDEQIAYLTADSLVHSPFATPYRVDEVLPFNLKHINQRLRQLDIGELVIKKRGFPVDPEQFRRRLKYGGSGPVVVLILTHVQRRPTAILCRRA